MSEKSVSIRPTIARIWRGRTRPERADEYETYNYDVGIKPLIEKGARRPDAAGGSPGRNRVRDDLVLGKRRGDGALHRRDPARIHHLPRDAEFLIELPSRVQVLEIRATHGDTGSDDP